MKTGTILLFDVAPSSRVVRIVLGYTSHPTVLRASPTWSGIDRILNSSNMPRIADLVLKLPHLENIRVHSPSPASSGWGGGGGRDGTRIHLNNFLQRSSPNGARALQWETQSEGPQYNPVWTATASGE